MAIPALFQLSELSRKAKAPIGAPSPMHLTQTEKVDELADRLFKSYTTEQNVVYLREASNGDAVRKKLIPKLTNLGRFKEAFEIAIELNNIGDRDAQLNDLIQPLVLEDACTELNRLVDALSLPKKNPGKFKIGVTYADRNNFVRVLETYFTIDRMQWRNNLFVAIFKKVPEQYKKNFLDFIITRYLDQNEIEYAVEAVKKCHGVNREMAFYSMASYLVLTHKLGKIALILNELSIQNRFLILGKVLTPQLILADLSFVIEVVKPLTDCDDVLFRVGEFLIRENKLESLHLIVGALNLRKDEFIKRIPAQPMVS